MITTASQNQPKKPASRFGFPTPRLPVSLTDLAFFVEACITSVISHPFQLACGLVAAAEPLHPEGDAEAQNHEEHRDHAGGAHLVGLEATDVHVEWQDPSGVAGPALGHHEDQVEVRQ